MSSFHPTPFSMLISLQTSRTASNMKANYSSLPAPDPQTLTHRHISTAIHAQPPPTTKEDHLIHHHHHQEEADDHMISTTCKSTSTKKKQTTRTARSCCGSGGGRTGHNNYSYMNTMVGVLGDASFMKWTSGDIMGVVKYHPIPCVFAASLLFFMGVEYTLSMIPSSSPPFDIGFVATAHLHSFLQSRPNFNTLFAGLNTVFVGMQTGYILWTWLVEGRPRATIAVLFMFTFRGILGYSTQLPLPEGFLGSGVDFPVGNVSFFLFYSGHVAASIIASLDMKRIQRWELACAFDVLNILQIVRLLSTRGHYTIDLAVGVGAGILFDSLAGKYEFAKRKAVADAMGSSTTYAAFLTPSNHGNVNGVHY